MTRIITTEAQEYRLEVLRDGEWALWGTYSHCERAFVERIAARIEAEQSA